MKTQEQIIEKIKNAPDSFVGHFTQDALMDYVTGENAAKHNCTAGLISAEEWQNEVTKPVERDSIVQRMREYMVFAWEKWEDDRGLSVARAHVKFLAWVWLLGDEDEVEEHEIPSEYFCNVCDFYGFPISEQY